MICDSAGEEKIEAGLVVPSIDIGGSVPGVHGGNESGDLILSLGVSDEINELAGGAVVAGVNFIDGVPNAIPRVVIAVGITCVGGCGHQNAQISRAYR